MKDEIKDVALLLGGVLAVGAIVSMFERQVGLGSNAMVAGSGPKPHIPDWHTGRVMKIFSGIPDIPRPGPLHERFIDPSRLHPGTGHFRA